MECSRPADVAADVAAARAPLSLKPPFPVSTGFSVPVPRVSSGQAAITPSVMLVEELAAALEQLNAAAEGWLGPAWREVPAFVLFFGALFAVSLLFWVSASCCTRHAVMLACSAAVRERHISGAALGCAPDA